eukprot:361260-Chlamydomonas_euryale.AAC.7
MDLQCPTIQLSASSPPPPQLAPFSTLPTHTHTHTAAHYSPHPLQKLDLEHPKYISRAPTYSIPGAHAAASRARGTPPTLCRAPPQGRGWRRAASVQLPPAHPRAGTAPRPRGCGRGRRRAGVEACGRRAALVRAGVDV